MRNKFGDGSLLSGIWVFRSEMKLSTRADVVLWNTLWLFFRLSIKGRNPEFGRDAYREREGSIFCSFFKISTSLARVGFCFSPSFDSNLCEYRAEELAALPPAEASLPLA